MTTGAARLLRLLDLLGARRRWPGTDLAERLGISARTLRRDIECLRTLGYPIDAGKGPDGGYALGDHGRLPPLMLDDEQAIGVMIALQTAPTTVRGIDDAVARALTSIRQILPSEARAEAEALQLISVRNQWEFAAAPIDADLLRTVGSAIRRTRCLRVDYLADDLRRPQPGEADFVAPFTVEPHYLVVWAGRWYLVGYLSQRRAWKVLRVDRLHAASAGAVFTRRPPPDVDIVRYVTTSYDRDDVPADWQCQGTVEMNLPAEVVARWAPGGTRVQRISATQCRLTIGAWSWAGIAGLLATFDAEFTVVEPDALRQACHDIAGRLNQV